MKTRLCTLTLLCIFSVPVYMYDLVNYSINKNKEQIESFLEKKTNQKVEFGKIHLSFSSLTFSDIRYKHKNVDIYLKNIEILPSTSFLFGFDPNKLVQSIYIENLSIIRKKEIDFDENQSEDYSVYLNYIKKMRRLQIDKITYKDSLDLQNMHNIEIDKTIFEKIGEYLYFNTNAQYAKNKVHTKGTINLYKALKTNKVDADFQIESNKISLVQFNNFINNPHFIITKGDTQINEQVKIKDNKFEFKGLSKIENLNIKLFDKPIKVNNLQVKNSFSNKKLNFDFLNNIKVNNTPFYINRISINADEKLRNLKHVAIESKKLKYYGTFSNKFNEDVDTREIKVKFNTVDLNYFNRLGVLEIPKPYNETIVKNGTFDIVFQKDKYNQWHMNYKVLGEASLNTDDILLESTGILDNSKLSLTNFKINHRYQEGIVNYDLSNHNFDLNIKVDLDKKVFAHIKKQYYVPFDIEMLSYNSPAHFDLRLNNQDNHYIYDGSVQLAGNDVSLKHNQKEYLFSNAKGFIAFSNNTVDIFDIKSESINKDQYQFKNVSLIGDYKNHIISGNIETPNIESKVIYNLEEDSLKLDMKKAHFSFNELSKNNIEVRSSIDQEINFIEVPKKLDIFTSDLKIDNLDMGAVLLKSIKNDNNEYDIETVLVNDGVELKVDSKLNANTSSIQNNLNLKIDNLENFIDKYDLEKTVKDGDLNLSAQIETNINQLYWKSIINKSKGKVEFTSKDGGLTKVDSNAGFILNLLSFQTLPNLASLQFGNIFTNKFNYDTINGKLIINEGRLNIDKLNLESTILDANMTGNVEIESQDLDLKLTVTPKVTNSVVFTAVTAASVFNPLFLFGGTILEKVIPLPEIIKYKYKINGNLNYPIISDESQNKSEIQN